MNEQQPSPLQKIISESLQQIVQQNSRLITVLEDLARSSGLIPEARDKITMEIPSTTNWGPRFPADNSESDNLKIVRTQDVAGKPLPKKKSDGRGKATWDTYALEYQKRYMVAPVRNAMTNRACTNLVDRLGAEEAPLVVRHYVWHNDFFYTKNGHPLHLCVKDAEKLRTEWKTGRKVTTATARQLERTGHNQEVVRGYLESENVQHEPDPRQTEIPHTADSAGGPVWERAE